MHGARPQPTSPQPNTQFGSRNLPSTMIISRNVATWLSNAIFFMRIEKLLHIPLFRAHKLYMATQRRRLVLVNSHPSIEWERPLPPNVRYVGPPFLAKARAPSHVSSPDFILVSLGTFVSMDAGEYWELARALATVKVDVVFKVAPHDLPSDLPWERLRSFLPPHVHLHEHVKQQELLGESGCRGFISQGGIFSVLESASAGVPLGLIPFLGDQEVGRLDRCLPRGCTAIVALRFALPFLPSSQDNTDKVVAAGMGVRIAAFNASFISAAIERLLYDEILTLRARQVAAKIRNSPQLPTEAAFDGIEEFLMETVGGR